MTELTEPESAAAAQLSPQWPTNGDMDVRDPAVAQALTRLEALPQLPVTHHESTYSELHDELLAALNTLPTNTAPTNMLPADGHSTDGTS